ncbi:IS66 family insertion sequence element accessory protein TnpB [Salinimicrobium sp. MT39]|uniref:IS66 family insertion sequence element accessory protein TnpB n=1 Tax=Salinimicrobium profundisediminis TaxID=2994553 RepID=A0A9X3D181_9FLAO|nr:IS66 family insertion sequence element accessory protein TnpB [Salinimicrobium profundisediminis]MCX2839409.1 IS66 family insertion sequence element accessory protein TnpB [Salinimicrobium profundisediminis]
MSKQEEMYTLVNEYRNSGLSAKAFSTEKGISPSTFCYWIRKKKDEDQPGGFVEVTKGLNASSGELELIYPNGVKLQMNAADLGLIARLVKLY